MTEEINISEELEKLLKVQALDSEIYKLSAEKDDKPGEIKELQDSLEHETADMKAAEDNLQSLQLKHKEKEGDLKVKEEQINKLQGQLYQIKTNKEYTAMLHEIDGHKADNSLLEEDILKLMDEIDKAQADVAQEKSKFDDITKKVDTDVKVIAARVKEIDGALSDLKAKREAMLPGVNESLRKTYERILEGKDGLAVVEVTNDSCGGCYMPLRSQIMNEIKLREHIVQCGSCQRMLYIKDE
ncbi:zinc ribbon domain-containing protein [Candidatus Omnitrophota bacterium]